MDKQNLIQKIEAAQITAELREELLNIVNSAGEYSDEVLLKVKNRLGQEAEGLIEEITNLQVQDATNEFEKKMDKIEEDIDQFNDDLKNKTE